MVHVQCSHLHVPGKFQENITMGQSVFRVTVRKRNVMDERTDKQMDGFQYMYLPYQVFDAVGVKNKYNKFFHNVAHL